MILSQDAEYKKTQRDKQDEKKVKEKDLAQFRLQQMNSDYDSIPMG